MVVFSSNVDRKSLSDSCAAISFRAMLHPAALLAIVCAGYVLALLIYRLWLSPLAKFPGPKIAAATLWYETYHDAFRWGQYTFEIAKMHERYGKRRITTQRPF